MSYNTLIELDKNPNFFDQETPIPGLDCEIDIQTQHDYQRHDSDLLST